jgi:hypothetical protein
VGVAGAAPRRSAAHDAKAHPGRPPPVGGGVGRHGDQPVAPGAQPAAGEPAAEAEGVAAGLAPVGEGAALANSPDPSGWVPNAVT